MKVMLIVPYQFVQRRWSKDNIMPPLGVASLGAVLEKAGFKVEIVDTFIEDYDFEKLRKRFLKSKPNIVGVSFTTENRFEAFKTMETAKQALPNCFVVAGNAHSSLTQEDSLDNCKALDAIVNGEGEYTFLELCRAVRGSKKIDRIQGISYRKNGKPVTNPPRLAIQNLDRLPMPARHLLNMKKYRLTLDVLGIGKLPAANLITSRGCPMGCNFCSIARTWGLKYRARSAKKVVDEIEHVMKEYGVRAIWFFDATFTTNPRRVEEVCDLIIKKGIKVYWHCNITVNSVNRELLKKMKEAGCYEVAFGVESGSQRILNEVVGKRITIKQVRDVMKWCREFRIQPHAFFIVSHPKETMEDVRKTLDLMRELKAQGATLGLGVMRIYPGTRIEDAAREKGIISNDFTWTKPYKETVSLPSAQGNAPIFIDRLTWKQISEVMVEYAQLDGFPIMKSIPGIFRDIRSPRDVWKYAVLLYTFMKLRVGRLFGSK